MKVPPDPLTPSSRKTNRRLAGFAALPLLAACVGQTAPGPDTAEGYLYPTPTEVCVSPAGFPANMGYPQAAATIERWVARRDEAAARRHGWLLWAGLNAPASGLPVWRSWCTSTQAFAPSPGSGGTQARPATLAIQAFHRRRSLNDIRRANAAETGEDPINLPGQPAYPVPQSVIDAYPQCYVPPAQGQTYGTLADGPTFQNNGDIMIAGVVYNPPAFDWIRSRNLYLASTLNGMLPPSGQTAQMPAMPPGSIVLKPMMWPIQGNGYTALPVWDDLPPGADDGSYVGFEIQPKWPRAVAVTPNPTPQIATVDVTYLNGVLGSDGNPLGPITYRGAPVAPLRDFYAFSVPDLQAMDPCDRAILDASAWWAYGRTFSAGDYLAVVAMHIITKEQPDWTFQSLWWHDRPNDGPYAADRPVIPHSRAPGPWRHYLMTSTYGITAEPGGDSWPVAYNPYIELAADHPIRTNCMNCHHRAAWPRFPAANYEAPSPPGPDALQVFDWQNPIFDNLLTVDSMWAISDRAAAPGGGRGASGGRASRQR